SGWGWTFLREWVVEFGVFSVLLSYLFFPAILDLLWAFWDKDRQTLHDKIVKTYVVDDRSLATESDPTRPAVA
ncbi:MAG: RDD family protein, partial [SAR202 cluster bacterium]|nr:RDD family protein [SAR202 cluster bacterium]